MPIVSIFVVSKSNDLYVIPRDVSISVPTSFTMANHINTKKAFTFKTIIPLSGYGCSLVQGRWYKDCFSPNSPQRIDAFRIRPPFHLHSQDLRSSYGHLTTSWLQWPPGLSTWALGPFHPSFTQHTPPSHSLPPSKGFLRPMESGLNSNTGSPMSYMVWPGLRLYLSPSHYSLWPPFFMSFSNTPQSSSNLEAFCLARSSSLPACG